MKIQTAVNSLAAIFVILSSVNAVDRNKFRTCQQSSFCRRCRGKNLLLIIWTLYKKYKTKVVLKIEIMTDKSTFFQEKKPWKMCTSTAMSSIQILISKVTRVLSTKIIKSAF